MRSYAGLTEGMTVYVRWNGEVRECVLSALRIADDGLQNLVVPPGMARVRMADGDHDVSLALVSPIPGPLGARLILRRDGAEVMRGTELEIWDYIRETHCYSVHHACRYEGYSIEPEGPAPAGVPGDGGGA